MIYKPSTKENSCCNFFLKGNFHIKVFLPEPQMVTQTWNIPSIKQSKWKKERN